MVYPDSEIFFEKEKKEEMKTHTKRIGFRVTEDLYDKLLAICRVDKQCKTRVLSDLIEEKFKSKSAYGLRLFEDREGKKL